MTDAEFPKFADALGSVAIAFSRDLDEPTIALYFKALKDVPWDLVRHATADLIKFDERWPSPARWRKVVDECQDKLSESDQRQLLADQKLLPPPVWDGETQSWVSTYHCLNCHDTGWRPGCGCPRSALTTLLDLPTDVPTLKGLGLCKFHGGVEKHGVTYPQGVKPCECRSTNPAYNVHHPAGKTRYSKAAAPRKRRAEAE